MSAEYLAHRDVSTKGEVRGEKNHYRQQVTTTPIFFHAHHTHTHTCPPSFISSQSGVNGWILEIQKVSRLHEEHSLVSSLREVSFWHSLERSLEELQVSGGGV